MFSSHDAFTIALQALFFTKVFLLEIHREKKETQIVWKMYYSFIIPFKYTMMLNNYAYKVTSISIYPSQHSVIYIHTAEPLRWIYAIDCRPLLSFAYMYSDISLLFLSSACLHMVAVSSEDNIFKIILKFLCLKTTPSKDSIKIIQTLDVEFFSFWNMSYKIRKHLQSKIVCM